MNFPDTIRNLRADNKITQKELSKAINIAQSTISGWEQGLFQPTADALIQLSLFFGVSADYLLGLEDETGEKTYTPKK